MNRVLTYTMFAGGTTYGRSPNEQSRIELSIALTKFRTVSIDPVLEAYGTPFDRSVREGKNYSDKAPGLSLLGVPIVWIIDIFLPREGNSQMPSYWAVRHLLTWLLVVLPAALFPFFVLRRSAPNSQNSVEASLFFALLTPILTYSSVFFGHVPAGFFASVSWMLVLEPGKNTRVPSSFDLVLAGIFMAIATTIEYPTGIVAFIIIFTLAFRRLTSYKVFLFIFAFTIGLIPCLLYHQFAFGSPLSTGYAFKSDWWHGTLHRAGFLGIKFPNIESLLGILIGTKRGILFYSPILLIVPIGWIQMEKQKKWSSIPYITLVVFYIWFAAGFSDWQAGWSAAARHLIPVVMIMIFPFAKGLDYLSRRDPKKIYINFFLLCITVISFAGIYLSVSVSPFFPEHFSSPLGQLVLPALAEGFYSSTILSGQDIFLRGYALCLVVGIGFVSVLYAFSQYFRPFKSLVVLPFSFVSITITYLSLLWMTAKPLTEEEWNVRNDVLRHIGYPQNLILNGSPQR